MLYKIVVVFILISSIIIIILLKNNITEYLGTYVQLNDYNLVGNNITCKSKNIVCNQINPKYRKKPNFDNIMCHNNCKDPADKLKTCCDSKTYCQDNMNICTTGWENKNDSHTIECVNDKCTRGLCCNIKQDVYTEYKNSIIDEDDYSKLTSIFNTRVKEHSYTNIHNFCKSACSLNEIMPNCLGFSVNEDNECRLFGLISSYRDTNSNDKKTDLYIKNGVTIKKEN
tara:strand:+ start:72 stop:752 length:681 start_codon:yes stop_codon:yes gene_type:complete